MIGFGEAVAPREVQDQLRAIDPDAELLHLGGPEWLLCVRQPNPGAQERIQRQLKLLDPHKAIDHEAGREFQLLQLYASGVRPIQLYRLGELDGDGERITFGWIVEDFRIRDFNWRVRPRETEREMRDAMSLDAGNRRRARVMAEYMEAEGPSLFRYVMKRARSFLQRAPLHTGG